jgi:hypothetical protein
MFCGLGIESSAGFADNHAILSRVEDLRGFSEWRSGFHLGEVGILVDEDVADAISVPKNSNLGILHTHTHAQTQTHETTVSTR